MVDGADGKVQADQVIREARITASLSHPNVLPIYDLDLTDDGRPFFTMPRIHGVSLGALIASSRPDARNPAIADVNTVLRILLALGQALSYAHHQGVIHQDVKPDNIMIGEFGEVRLVDWGSACRIGDDNGPIYGTPLYMSPEQARSQRIDQRSDLYCLGATAFHALFLRLPTWSDSVDEFWEAKRRGTINPLSEEEQRMVPPAVRDILLKTLAADPDDRYRSAEELCQDLSAYQVGLAVSAHRENLRERLARWHRRHGRRFWVATLLAGLILSLVVALEGEHLKEIARWKGTPLFSESFAGDARQGSWKLVEGSFRSSPQGVVSTGPAASFLLLDRLLVAPVAIEYDAEILPDARPCDISLTWCRDRSLDASGAVKEVSGTYAFQVGALDDSFCVITHEHDYIAYSSFRPERGRSYHIRIEIIDDRLSLAVDGNALCSCRDAFPFHDGYLALSAYYPGKVFRNLRVYERRVAQKIAATAIGDAFALHGEFAVASDEYAHVADAYAGSALGQEARYRQGLCLWRLSRRAEAMAVWKSLRGGPWDGQVRLHDLLPLFEQGQHAQVLSGLSELARRGDIDLRRDVAQSWAHDVQVLQEQLQRDAVVAYLAMHDADLAAEATVDATTAQVMNYLGLYEDVLKRFPSQRQFCAWALLRLHRPQEVIERYPTQLWEYSDALVATGRSAQVDPAYSPWLYCRGLLARGELEQASAHPGCDFHIHSQVLIVQGRLGQAIRDSQHDVDGRDQAYAFLGRWNENWGDADLRDLLAGGRGHQRGVEEHLGPWFADLAAVRAWIAGDHAPLLARRGQHAPVVAQTTERDVLFERITLPFILGTGGDWSAFDVSLDRILQEQRYDWEQHPWFDAALLRHRLGEREFLQQPHRLFAPANLLLMQAMRAERDHDAATARSCYAAWLAIPAYARDGYPDPVWLDLVAWRQRCLAVPLPHAAPPSAPAPASPAVPAP